MKLTREELVAPIDDLITATIDMERRLADLGVSDHHLWMFATREMLCDIRRLQLMLRDAVTAPPESQIGAFNEFVEAVLYEVLPHVRSHMEEIESNVAAQAAGEKKK